MVCCRASELYLVTSPQRSTLPLLTWVVIGSTALVSIDDFTLLGLPATAFAWLIVLTIALVDLGTTPGRIRLPVAVWLPWVATIIIQVAVADTPNAFQRSVMMLVPLVAGMATSKHPVGEATLVIFRKYCRILAVCLGIGAVARLGFSIFHTLPDGSPLAPQSMTAALLGGVFAASFAFGRVGDVLWWGALVLIPLLGLNRMGIVANGLALPLTLAPLKKSWRIGVAVVIAVAALTLFQTDRFQRRMFLSGHGDLSDLTMDNQDVAMTGRRRMWEYLEAGVSERPWFGHGANTCEPIVSALTRGATHPHNDWLRVRYEYGNLGAVVLAFCIIAQAIHLWLRARSLQGQKRILAYAGASSFLTFALFMMTDNVILYAAFFGNLQFTIIGLAYAPELQQAPPPEALPAS
jgi:O-antigen ligase